MSRSGFVRRVQANLDHWQSTVHEINAQAYAPLDPEWSNLLQSIDFGLRFPETRPAAAALWKDLIGYINSRGLHGPWEVITDRVAEILDELPPAQACGVANEIGFFLHKIFRNQDSLAYHERARTLAEDVDDALELGLAISGLAHAQERLHRYSEAEENARIAHAMLEDLDSTGLHSAANINLLGLIHLDRGEYEAAVGHFQEAYKDFMERGHSYKAILSLHNLAFALQRSGNYQAAIEPLQKAKSLLDPGSGSRIRAVIQVMLGTIYFQMEDYALAKESFLVIDQHDLERQGNTEELAYTNNNLGNVALKEADWPLARDYLSFAAELFERLKLEIDMANSLGDLGTALLQLGERAAAKAALDKAIRLLEKYPENAWARKRLEAILAQRRQSFG